MDLSGYQFVDFTSQAPVPEEAGVPQPKANSEQPTGEALRGWVNSYYIKMNGKRLGPYYVRRWKQNGKLHKEYVEARDLQRVKEACERYRQKQRRGRTIAAIYRDVQGNLAYTLAQFQEAHRAAADNLEADPLLTDESRRVFTVRPDSPVAKRGVRIPGVSRHGEAPDIGAFEVSPERRSAARP